MVHEYAYKTYEYISKLANCPVSVKLRLRRKTNKPKRNGQTPGIEFGAL